jgi:CDP-paratose 2-epimerase
LSGSFGVDGDKLCRLLVARIEPDALDQPLEATRQSCPDACFIFSSTNKVYGGTPNRLPLVEQSTRWGLLDNHPYGRYGIDGSMSIDQTMHRLFGASEVAADVLVQQYGRYFGMKTVCFRGGCLTGPGRSGAQLHDLLAYW